MAKRSVGDRLRVMPARSTAGSILAGIDPASTPGFTKGGKAAALRDLAAVRGRLAALQERLYAEGDRSVLLVLQGMDTSGKDGAVGHVFASVNPQGCRIVGFKQPTPQELKHHFLWRIRRALPAPREIGIFNRSHYEDVLVVRVHGLAPESVWTARYAEINRFEASLPARGITIVKVCLHISYDEQRRRLLDRLADPTKHWKFREADVDERARWDEYRVAYDAAIERCSTETAPWYVVPADRKWYRNWAITHLLIDTLEEMNPVFPQPDLDIPSLRARLTPPG